MKENKDENAITSSHRNCLMMECCFWIYHIIVIALMITILVYMSIAFQRVQDVTGS
jgi:hypothetical protein